MRKWLIISLSSAIILAVIISIVFIIANNNKTSDMDTTSQRELANKIQENIEQSNIQLVSTASIEDKTSPNITISFKTYYKKCEHTTIKNIQIPNELVNKTKTEIEDAYTGWNIEEFTSNNVVLKTEKEGICDEHYILKENNGYISIYRIDENERETLIETTSVVTAYLPEADLLELRQGIRIIGKDKLNARLEDYE